MRVALAGVLGAFALQLSQADANPQAAYAGKRLRSQATPVRAAAEAGYFILNYYVGTTCAEDSLIKADVLNTNTCVPYGDNYLMVTCDVTGAQSAYYSDNTCETVIPGSEDTWDTVAIDGCTDDETYSMKPQCATSLPSKVTQLSHLTGFANDNSCSETTQAISAQYFVTDECFTLSETASRVQYCSDLGAQKITYTTDDCTGQESSFDFYSGNECHAPQQVMDQTQTSVETIFGIGYTTLSCNSTDGLPDDDDAAGPVYFSRYYFAGENCESDNLYSVDVITLDKCVESDTAGKFIMVTCDSNVVNSAYYSDAACTTVLEGSESTWSDGTVGECNNHGTASIYPRCESGVSKNAQKLSHAEGYMGDETCSDDDNLLIEQFFVTNKCISTGDLSQQQFCDDSTALFKYYNAPDCPSDHLLAVSAYPIDQCQEPEQASTDTADIALLPKTSYRIMHCNSTDGLPDDNPVPLYFTRYMYVGATCDENRFISAEVLLSGKCIKQSEDVYMLLECDETGAHSALYSDAICTEKIEGSEDSWNNAPMDTCTPDNDGVYSVYPTCDVKLKEGVEYLSNAAAYFDDAECSDKTQQVSTQYFVTDKCFMTSPTSSRAMYCDERGVGIYFYNGINCDQTKLSSLNFYNLDTCYDPFTTMPEDTADISLMTSSSHRTMSCNSTGGLPDIPLYFTRYLYVGDTCDDDKFISAEALLADRCMKRSDDTYMKVECDSSGAHSALYSDPQCLNMIEGSEDSWNNAPMDTCTPDNDGVYSVYPTCDVDLKEGVEYLSNAAAYFDDAECSDKTQQVSTQYFVTDKCFQTGPTSSRAMYCDERGVGMYFYKGTDCDQEKLSSLNFYDLEACYDPFTTLPEGSAEIALLTSSSYRHMSCNSTGALPDTPLYFTRYLYVGEDCEDENFISAEVLLADKCMKHSSGDYMKVECDETGAHSALYSDPLCSQMIDGSEDHWDNAPMETCSGKDGYSVYPTCDSSIDTEIKQLSYVAAYVEDSDCSDKQQQISRQYFVTDKCFQVTDTSSRAMYCDDRGVAFYSYSTPNCEPHSDNSVAFYDLDVCYAPFMDMATDKAPVQDLSASSYRTMFCNSTGGLPDDDVDDELRYFTKYFYTGDTCDQKQLISAEAIMVGKCIESNTDGHYIMVSCDGGSVRTVMYEDDQCTKVVPGTTSFWTNAPLQTCTAKDGYSVYPVCETKLPKSVRKLSHSNAYLDEDSCDNEDELIQQQYFVTNQCFAVNGTTSRKQVCNSDGLTVRFYQGAGCDPDKVQSVVMYHLDTCYPPWQEIPDDTTDLNLVIESTSRTLVCAKKDDDDDDDDDFGGLTIGGLVGVIVGSLVVVAFGAGLFFHLNKKPSTTGHESLLDNQH